MEISESQFTLEGEYDSEAAPRYQKLAIEGAAKIYGPIYTRMVSQYGLEFEAKMLKEKPPLNEGLDATINYILKNMNRYPRVQCALAYAIGKADAMLQGSVGAGAKRAAYNAMKIVLEKSGLLSGIEKTDDAFKACKMFANTLKLIKSVVPARYAKSGEKNNEIIAVHHDCPYKDSCRARVNEGLTRMIGGKECTALLMANACIEIITKKQFDYVLDEFDTPDCKGRIFEI
jgi:hypothetical protein